MRIVRYMTKPYSIKIYKIRDWKFNPLFLLETVFQ
jgi:hypothetical protein